MAELGYSALSVEVYRADLRVQLRQSGGIAFRHGCHPVTLNRDGDGDGTDIKDRGDDGHEAEQRPSFRRAIASKAEEDQEDGVTASDCSLLCDDR